MVKCSKCGTGWTTAGLPLCPICGTDVREPAASSKAVAPVERVATEATAKRTAVLEAPVEPLKVKVPKAEPVSPVSALKDLDPGPERPPEPRKPEPRPFERIQLPDPSAMMIPVVKELPLAPRPLNGPVILGALAYVGVFLLPLTVAFESNRVLGILGFCMTAFFAPFAPIAWMVGLTAEKRRRDQGLRPEGRVSLGRLLGQWGTLLLVSEVTLALVGIAALRLSGKFPLTFWASFY